MKNVVTILLCVLLALPAAAANKFDAVAAKIPLGTQVEVRLKDKQPIRGSMGEVFPGGFTIQVWVDGRQTQRRILLDEVQSLRKRTGSGIKGYAIAVVFVAVSAAVASAVSGAVRR